MRFLLEEGLRLASNEEIIAIPSDANLAPFRNIEEIYYGIKARISELIATLSFRIAGVLCVQSCTPA